jgi:periplasmic divalent cation tolerance protein
MKGGFLFVYVTCASKKEAEKIGRAVVKEKLAACANILAPIQSIYGVKGTLKQAKEVPLLLKTHEARFAKLAKRITALHSYDMPCIAGLKPEKMNDSFAGWILQQTKAN